jgi:hypothetical protein
VLSFCVWCACVCGVCVRARVPAATKEKKEKEKGVQASQRSSLSHTTNKQKNRTPKNVRSEEQHVAHCKKSQVKYLLSKNNDEIKN